MRREQINFRCSAKEGKRLRRVALHHGLGVGALIRMLVKREAIAIKKGDEK